MIPTLHLPLLPGWQSNSGTVQDGEIELAHLETFLPDDRSQSDLCLIDIYAGAMPEGSDAEQEALRSYQDIVGDDEEDPLIIWPFQGKEAYGYEVLCEDDSIMRVMCIGYAPSRLLIINIVACDDEHFDEAVQHVEKHLTLA